MVQLRRSQDRGYFDHGWLKTYHTFSFAGYFDPNHMGFSVLRVINEDRVEAGMGFPTHGHRDMEILTYVLEGELAHKDTLGNSSIIRPGEIQAMSAGTGVRHSEHNHRLDGHTHFYQIWIVPHRQGHAPQYGQKSMTEKLGKGELVLLASEDGRDESLLIHQDARVFAARLPKGGELSLPLRPLRNGWLQAARGELVIDGIQLRAGDGAAFMREGPQHVRALTAGELLFFDLP